MAVIWLQECRQEDKEEEGGKGQKAAGASTNFGQAEPRPHNPSEEPLKPGATLLSMAGDSLQEAPLLWWHSVLCLCVGVMFNGCMHCMYGIL